MHRSGRPPTQRQLRVGELLRHGLSELFARNEVGMPELDTAAITVLEVSVNSNLQIATVFVMPLGGEGADDVLAHLDRVQKRIRGLLSRKVALKHMPEIKFTLDTSLDYAGKIDRLLETSQVAEDVRTGKSKTAE